MNTAKEASSESVLTVACRNGDDWEVHSLHRNQVFPLVLTYDFAAEIATCVDESGGRSSKVEEVQVRPSQTYRLGGDLRWCRDFWQSNMS